MNSHISNTGRPWTPTTATTQPKTGRTIDHSRPSRTYSARDVNYDCPVLYLNARSLKSVNFRRNKLVQLQNIVATDNIHMVAITETWLNSTVSDLEILPSQYAIHRKDREETVNKRGGGVMLAVSNCISSERRKDLEPIDEILVCSIDVPNVSKLMANVCYRPPSSDVALFVNNFTNTVKRVSSVSKNIVVLGDLNLPHVDWANCIYNGQGAESELCDTLNELHLIQVNNVPSNVQRNQLDLVFTNVPEKLSAITEYPGDFDTDHNLLKFSMYLGIRPKQGQAKVVFNYKKGNYRRLRETLRTKCLSDIVDGGTNVNEIWQLWSESVNDAIADCVPRIKLKDHTAPPWIDAEARHIQNRKLTAWRKAKKTNCDSAWSTFRDLRNRTKKLLNAKYRNFMRGLSEGFATNSKRFWSLFRCKSKSRSIPLVVEHGAEKALEPLDKAKLFNKYFHSTFRHNAGTATTLPEIDALPECGLESVLFNSNMVQRALSKLDVHKASGPDDISATCLKECAGELAPSLAKLFNLSMATGQLPSQWKSANVVPVHKNKSKRVAGNYRPVSLLCIISKVMERCIFDEIYPLLKPHISEHQHGFVKGRSCATQLLETYHSIGETLDTGGQTDIIFLDLAKAFDSVSHPLLLHKLTLYGISGKLLNWLRAYVTDRKQRTVVEGEQSDWLPVSSGVPQGSILGPLLFILFINDLPECVLSSLKLFADDAKCYRSITSISDCHILQADLDSLAGWCKKWDLDFSHHKCVSMSVTRSKKMHVFNYFLEGTQLQRVEHFTDLGVVISSNLSFHDHVKSKVNKAYCMAGILNRTTDKLVAANVMVRLFETLVRSHLEYCSQMWSPPTKRDVILIEQVQRRFTKTLLYNTVNTNLTYKERLMYLALLPLSYRREISDLLFFFKCLNQMYDVDFSKFVTQYDTDTRLRSSNSGLLFRVQKCKTVTFQSSYFLRIVKLWNALPLNARQSNSFTQFRNNVKEFYQAKLVSTFNADDTNTWVTN